MRRPAWLPLALTILWACACSEPRKAPQAGTQDAGGEGTVRIVFSLPGDDIGSPEGAAPAAALHQASLKPAILADFAKLPQLLDEARRGLGRALPNSPASPSAPHEDPKQLSMF